MRTDHSHSDLTMLIKRQSLPMLLFILAAGIAGCGVFGEKKAEEDPEITIPKKQYEALINKNKALRDGMSELMKKNKALKEKIALLESKKESQKMILLFGGKIRYVVDADAIMDYEDAIVTKMLKDSEFKEVMDRGGKDADLALISVLKEISPDDRRVTRGEAKRYLQRLKDQSR